MINLFRYVGLRHLLTKPTRTLLTTVGVALGVSLFTGIQIINQSTLSSFKENVDAVAGKTSLTVSGGEAGFLEEKLDVIQKFPGVKSAVPMVESRGYLVGKPGAGVDEVSGDTVLILGVDLLREQAVRTYKTTDQQLIDDPLVFLNQPDSMILTHEFAQQHQLKIDSKFELATAHGKKTFTVRGLLSPEGPAKAYGGSIAIMDIDGARMNFGKEGKLDRIDIVTRSTMSGEELSELGRKLEAVLGPGFHVERPSSQSEGMARMVKSYQIMMTLFSSLALLVGLFLITNSVSIAVAERKKEIGTLRALGANRAGILTLFLSEALAMGVVGAFVGAWMGRGLASMLVRVVSQSMSTQYLTKIEVSHLQFGWRDVALAVAIGAGAAFIAALWPSFRATQVQPLEAMLNRTVEGKASRASFHFWSPYIGLALSLSTTMSAYFGWGRNNPVVENLNEVLAVLGAVLLGPAVVTYLVRAFAPLSRLLGGTVARLASDNLVRNPARTASNVVSLMVGLILVILVSSINTSFRVTVQEWFGRILQSDLLVSSNGQLVAYQTQPLHESIGKELQAIPGVRTESGGGIYGLRFIHLFYEGKKIGIKAYDAPDPVIHYATLDMVDRPAEAAGQDLYHSAEPVVLISENFQLHFGNKTGETIYLDTPSGRIGFKIVGVMRDFASDVGVLYLNREQYKKYWNDPLINAFGVKLALGASLETVRKEITHRLGQSKNLIAISNAELRKQMEDLVDQSFANTRAIEAAALLVGLLGLMNTLLISVMERMREIGMLRAIGMSRGQVMRMIFQEALMQGGFGALTAVVVGAWLAYLWITYSLSHILGWIIQFHFPWMSIFTTVAVGVGVSLFAGFLPARRAARAPITEALDYE